MKILVVSDWHLKEDTNIEICKEYIDKMQDAIVERLTSGELLFIIVCGDIIDQGHVSIFNTANILIKYILMKFSDYSVEFAAIPGNHDFNESDKTFTPFDDCINTFAIKTHRYENETTYSYYKNGINLIFTNSAYKKEIDKGCLEFEKISPCLKRGATNILVAHHNIVGVNDGDDSNINNGQQLLDMASRDEIQYLIHGHSHIRGYIHNSSANGLKIIGIGPMLYLSNSDIQQFLLIECNNKCISKFEPYTYNESKREYELVSEFDSGTDDKYKEFKLELKRTFSFEKNYFPRKVVSYDKLMGSAIELYLNKNQSISLFNLCLKEKRVVLLGEAGSGKTYELKDLYNKLILDDENYLPVYFQLKDYIGQAIEELIPVKFKDVDRAKLFLIFDGFDEIENSKIKLFAQNVNNFVIQNEDTHLLVSTRGNFYLNATDNKNNGTLNDFVEFGLYPIDNIFVKESCEKFNVDYTSFLKEAQEKEMSDLIKNPFYLIDLIEEYKSKNNLPYKNQIMEMLCCRRFDLDGIKYYYQPINIEERTVDLKNILSKIAFSMQCLNKNYLNNEEYEELFNYEQRTLAKYSGLLKKDNNNWEFSHNNFREFFAARFLSKMQLNEILSIITLPDNKNVIRNSWFNVFSFLVLIYKNESLLDWVKENDPIKLTKFEPSRIDSETRKEVFISIFENVNEKSVWISHSVDNLSEYAKFGQSKEMILYLINKIKNPKHFREQANALSVLGEMDIISLNMKKDVKGVIFNYLKSDIVRDYEKQLAIRLLTNTKIYDDDVMQMLLSTFSNNYNPGIRSAINNYIIATNSVENNINFILDEIRNRRIIKNSDYYSIDITIVDALLMINTKNSVIQILRLFSEKLHNELFSDSNEVIKKVFLLAERLYSLNNDIFDEVLKLFITAEKEFEHFIINLCKTFFKNTGTIFNVYSYIIDNNPTNIDELILDDIMDETCEIDIEERYKNGTLINKDLFICFVNRRGEHCSDYYGFKKLIKEIDDIDIIDREQVDYISLKNEGDKKYLNSLFNIEEYNLLVEELILLSGDPDISNKDIVKKSFKHSEKRYDLDLVKWDLYHSTNEPQKIIDMVKSINWNEFSFYCIYDFLQSNEKYEISKKQIQEIYNKCMEIIDIVNPECEIKYGMNGSVTISKNLMALSYLSERFCFEYSKENLMKFLYVPSYIFNNKKISSHGFSQYLFAKIDKTDIQKWVIDKIQNGDIVGDLAICIINYCKNNNLDIAKEFSINLLGEPELSGFLKTYCVEYLVSIEGLDFVCNLLLPTEDINIINIFKSLKVNDNIKLENSLININKKSENGLDELEYLLTMNSEYAVNKYLKLCKDLNRIPDYSKDESAYLSVTESLSEINDIKLLPQIEELLILCYSKDFKDNGAFGLGHSVCNVIKNFAIKYHQKIENMLNEVVLNNKDNPDLKFACNYCLQSINYSYYQASDKPFSEEQIKQIIDR